MKPATALPWSVKRSGIQTYIVSGERLVCEAGSDAAYIAHACNLYPALVEALRLIRDYDPTTEHVPFADYAVQVSSKALSPTKEE